MDAVVVRVCERAGLDPGDAGACGGDWGNRVVHLPRAGVVLRLHRTYGDAERAARLGTAVRAAVWLAEQGLPVTPAAEGVAQPIEVDGWVATVWRRLDLAPAPADPVQVFEVLGGMLRALHALPEPPVRLWPVDLLGSLISDLDHARDWLEPELADWVRAQAGRVAEECAAVRDWRLGFGAVHGDARAANVSRTVRGSWLLGDWDSVAVGPRLHDLAPVVYSMRRFGVERGALEQLCAAYGVHPDDLEHDPALQLLVRARELRALAAPIRAGARRPAAVAEVRKRIHALMGNDCAAWKPL